jgi:hypothetical protein
MSPARKFLLCCKFAMAIPFVILILAAAVLTGVNLMLRPADPAGVVHPHSDKLPLKL